MVERTFGPAVVRRRLGSELRRLRQDAHMSLEEAGRELLVSPSKVSRLENGQSAAKLWDVRNLLTLYGVTDEDYRRRAERWVNESRARGWWHPYSDASPLDLDHFIALEEEAAEVRTLSGPFLYSLVQTEAYARALLEATLPDLSAGEIDGLAYVRRRRQAILTSEGPPVLRVIVDEATLWRTVGGPDVMHEQWEHLLSTPEAVDLRVRRMDADPHLALQNPFTIFMPREAAIDRTVVNLECAFHDSYWEEDDDVARFVASFDALHRTALAPDESRALIRRLLHGSRPNEARREVTWSA